VFTFIVTTGGSILQNWKRSVLIITSSDEKIFCPENALAQSIVNLIMAAPEK